MDLSELMINDWIHTPEGIQKVGKETLTRYDEGDLTPVTLDERTLIANGFDRHEYHEGTITYNLIDDETDSYVEICGDEVQIWRSKVVNNGKGSDRTLEEVYDCYSDYVFKLPKEVHVFQNILRCAELKRYANDMIVTESI